MALRHHTDSKRTRVQLMTGLMSLDIPETQTVSLETSTVHGRPSLSLCRLFFFFQFLHAHDRMNDQPSFHHLHHLTITSFRHPLDLPSGFTKGCSPSPSARRRNKGGFRLVPWTQNDITDGYLFVMFGCLSIQQNWAKPF